MKPIHWLYAAIAVAALVALTACGVAPQAKIAGSAVKVMVNGGHGSGVHLGNGYFLTAAHVTEGVKTVTIKTDDGKERVGEVMWGNSEYDVSLVYVVNYTGIAASELSCERPRIGDAITIIGNPLDTEFAQSWGKVSGWGKTGMENVYNGMWRVLMTMDITAAPGVSGAPVYDAYGRVVGILVSGAMSSRGTFAYTYAVPSWAICHVFGRVA
jgi:S1-C subfamily serine protease